MRSIAAVLTSVGGEGSLTLESSFYMPEGFAAGKSSSFFRQYE
jgi:hypothetical protein